jgi:hypothetical protein
MWWFSQMPFPVVQIMFLVLLLSIFLISIFTIALSIRVTSERKIFQPSRWAGTVSGLSVCAAFYQGISSGWYRSIMTEIGSADFQRDHPFGPPGHIARFIVDNPDHPIENAIRDILFYDPWLAAWLGFIAGIYAILASWLD